jgi:D-lactate dehydrogenase (cytochrome)
MRHDTRTAINELSAAFGPQLDTSPATVSTHASSASWVAPEHPDAVLFVMNETDVQRAVAICTARNCPIVPYGAGTSFEGSVNAPRGGLSLDFSRMAAVRIVHEDDLDCVVEPGIRRLDLNKALADHRLFFPVDPGSNASLGGMASTRASGTNAARLGTMRENVLAMRVVLPSGEVIATGRRARKSSAGYDLTRMFVGAEGTLGVITELTLKLQPLPRHVAAAVCGFPDVDAACRAYTTAAREGLAPARTELLDEVQVVAANRYSNLHLDPVPTLFLEFHGTERGVAEHAELFGEVARSVGGTAFAFAASPEDREQLWRARSNAAYAQQNLRPEAKLLPTDVCLPISRLGECITETKRDIDASGLLAPIVAHVGDGNFHAGILLDPDDAGEVANVKAFVDRLIRRALEMEGTCTGEHGIGQGKQRYMRLEHGDAAVELMRTLKQSIDPMNLMNPGKIVPPAIAAE